MTLAYDEVGKVDLSSIYNSPDPTLYFSTLSKLDYRVPQEAKAPFQNIIAARRAAAGETDLKIVDVGCSYGVNAALLKYGLSFEELSARYEGSSGLSRGELVKRDNQYFDGRDQDGISVVGVDPADAAIAYAMEAGLLDGGITTDLENDAPTAADAALIDGTGLVISTGCYGYVTMQTFARILDESGDRQPWLANMVLRMFDYSGAAEALEQRGYVTERVNGPVPQRRFVSNAERDSTLENLAAAGVDAANFEDTGWFFADLYVSRTPDAVAAMPLGEVVTPGT